MTQLTSKTLFLVLATLIAATESSAVVLLEDNATGGDCTLVGGWNGGTKTCTLTTDINDAVSINSSDMSLDCAGYVINGPAAAPGGVALGPGRHGGTVKNCDIGGFRFGIFAFGSDDHVFVNNRVHDNTSHGILTVFSDGNVISNNQLFDNARAGLRLQFGSAHTVVGNWAQNNGGNGMFLFLADESFVEDNEIVGAGGDSGGLVMESSSGNVLRNNRMSGAAFNFDISTPDINGFDHDIDTSNTIEGQFIYFLKNRIGTQINPDTFPNAGAVYCVECEAVIIEDYTFDAHSGSAVTLAGTDHSVVREITAFGYENAILGIQSNNNDIRDNRVEGTGPFGFGIVFSARPSDRQGGNDNLIESNVISAPGTFQAALRVSGERYIVRDNTMVEGGIMEIFSDDVLIDGNELSNSGGIRLFESRNAVIRGNTIRDGTPQFFFGPAPFYERGIDIIDSVDTVVTCNVVTNMLDHGLNIAESTNTLVFRNDIHGNALNGSDVNGNPLFQVSSDAAIELSDGTVGNFWGRDDDDGSPLFISGVDSNSVDVIDPFPLDESVFDDCGVDDDDEDDDNDEDDDD